MQQSIINSTVKLLYHFIVTVPYYFILIGIHPYLKYR